MWWLNSIRLTTLNNLCNAFFVGLTTGSYTESYVGDNFEVMWYMMENYDYGESKIK